MRYFTVLSVAFVGMLGLATALSTPAHAQEMEQSPAPAMSAPSDMGQDVNQIQEASPKAGAKHGKHKGKKHAAKKHHAKKHGKKHGKKHH